MPFINVRTSLATVSEGEQLLKDLSVALAAHTGKPEAYVMTLLQTSVPMTFGGSSEPCAYIEIKSIGALSPSEMTAAFTDLIAERTGIQPQRIFIGFEDVAPSLWGWNGKTFG